MMKSKLSLLVLLFFVVTTAGFMSACNDKVQENDKTVNEATINKSDESQSQGENGREETSTLIAPGIHLVIIEDMVFKPASLKIKKGEVVVWENKGIVEHNITDFPDEEWRSENFFPGQKWERTFDESNEYYCSIHPTMKGEIIVEE